MMNIEHETGNSNKNEGTAVREFKLKKFTAVLFHYLILLATLFGSCRLNISLMCLLSSFSGIFMTINLGMAIVCVNEQSIHVTDNSNENCSTIDDGNISTVYVRKCKNSLHGIKF